MYFRMVHHIRVNHRFGKWHPTCKRLGPFQAVVSSCRQHSWADSSPTWLTIWQSNAHRCQNAHQWHRPNRWFHWWSNHNHSTHWRQLHKKSRHVITSKPCSEPSATPKWAPHPWQYLFLSKLKEEGGLSEIILVIGWIQNLQAIEISLPLDKLKAWSGEICTMLQSKCTMFKDLNTLINHLNNAGHIIPLARFFLN